MTLKLSLRRFFAIGLLCFLPARAQMPPAAAASLDKAADLAAAGQFEKAETALLALEKSYPQEPEIQYRLGLILLRQKKAAAASRRLEAVAKLSPQSPLVWLAVAQARLQTVNREGAVQAAERAGALAPDEPAVWRALAMFYNQAQDFARAAEYEVRWSKRSPADTSSTLRAVEYYIRAGQPDNAIPLALAGLRQGANAPLEDLLGQAYRLKKQPAVAVEHLQQAIHLNPAEPRYYLDLAQLFLDHDTPQPAQLILEGAVRRFPKNVEVLRLLGLAYYAAGQKTKALDVFLEAVDLAPDADVSYASLEALLPDAEDRLGTIIQRLRSFCYRQPSSPLGYYLLALALSLESGESDETEALLRKAVAAAPSFWPGYLELHKYLKSAGKLEDAAQMLEKTLKLNPDSAVAHYSLAQIYSQLGENERAMEERKRHHELMIKQREETEKRRQEAPKLNYQLVNR